MRRDDSNKKSIVVVLSVLVGLIIVLLIAILVVINVVNTSRNADTSLMSPEEYEQMLISATEDCTGLKGLYGGGAVPKEVAIEAYNRKMIESGDNNEYKVSLTLCFVQYTRYHGATFEEVLTMLKAIEPYLTTDNNWIDYYNRLVVYYVEEDDWDNVVYYANLRDELMQAEWPDEDYTEEDTYEYDEYDYSDEYEDYEMEKE